VKSSATLVPHSAFDDGADDVSIQLTRNTPMMNKSIVHLIYSRAVDLRISLILANSGLSVRPMSDFSIFLQTIPSECEDIVLIDVASEHDIGVRQVEQLASHLRQPLVIPICANGSVDFCRKCFKAGAVDVLDKSFGNQLIVEAIQANLKAPKRDGTQCPQQIRKRERFSMLTNREFEIFSYCAQGLSNRDIGKILSLSPRTVEHHRANLSKKLNVRNLGHMVREYGSFLEEIY
jgi:two-component system response regulator FixJ